jgi:diaminohydroxyphosphoribosylaminopyrimidine deaminase/5-amino-6-(5-phosphoribosylamino)uracil reductase
MSLDASMLHRAALAGLRGFGRVEPNPMVGCIIGTERGEVLGIGHHRVFGGVHAEVDALEACARHGRDSRGATAWVTLEPCNHQGKQPPCVDALLGAGIARVVAARRDPHPVSAGGASRLREGGVRVEFSRASALACALAEPFAKRVATGLPWIIAKWAQTIDGKIATRSGDSKWISCPASRRRVHALRGRVDLVLTAIGTVLADDPLLTARGVPVRRVARRVVVDPDLRLPEASALVRSVAMAPLTVVTGPLAGAQTAKAKRLKSGGVEVIETGRGVGGLALGHVLRDLAAHRAAATVLVEAGPGLLGRLFEADLVDEALVFVGPRVLGDLGAPSAAGAGEHRPLAEAKALSLTRVRRVGEDVMMWYRRRG